MSQIKQNDFIIIGSDFNSKTKLMNLKYLEKKSDSTIIDYFDISNKTITNKDINDKVISYDLTNSIGNFLRDGETVESIDSNKKIVDEGDFIISRLRSYLKEFAIVQKQNLQQVVSTEYLVYKAKTKELSVNTLLAYVLNSKVQTILSLSQYGSEHPRFYEFAFNDLPVPKTLLKINKEIDGIFIKIFHYLAQSKQLYKQAEDILNKKLGLDKFKPSEENISIRKFSEYEKLNRLDAEYYQPKYDEIIKLINNQKNDILINIVDIKKSIEPGRDAYVDEGIPFIRVSDLNKFEIQESEIKIPTIIEPNIENLYPKKDTILLSKDGSVGMAYKVEKDLDIVTSGALLHLTIKNKEEVLPDYLTLVLNSLAIQLQAEQSANGAIIKHWKQEDIKNVVIPLLDFKVQKQIAEKVQESFKLRKQSKDLLNLAKQVVEIAIEKNETEALKLIN